MIKLSEAKQGNLFFNKFDKKEIIIDWTILPVPNRAVINSFDGVVLTEDHLLKFEFLKSTWRNEYNFCDGYLVKVEHGWQYTMCGNFDTIMICEIEFVHELQNLYQAITRKELFYKIEWIK